MDHAEDKFKIVVHMEVHSFTKRHLTGAGSRLFLCRARLNFRPQALSPIPIAGAQLLESKPETPAI